MWRGPSGQIKALLPDRNREVQVDSNIAFLLWPKTQNSRPGRNSPIAICFVPETLVAKSQAAEILSYLYL
jgi:hypothetical protein